MIIKSNVPQIRFSGFSGEWEEKKISDILNVIDGDRGVNYPKENDFCNNGNILFLNASNVTKNGFKFEKKQFITLEKSNLLGNGKLLLNDVILTSRGSVGHIAWYSEDIYRQYPFVRINSGMLILRVEHTIKPGFIVYSLMSPLGNKKINLISFGSAQPQLTKKDISNYVLYISNDTKEQAKIGNYFQQLDKLIEQKEKKYQKLKQLKKAMLNKMFPKDGADIPQIRFKGFSEKWEERALADICEIKKGEQFNKEYLSLNDIYPVINGGIEPSGYTNKYNTKANTITISEGGNSCGFINFITSDFWLGGHCYSILNFKFNELFFYQLLKHFENKIMGLRLGSGLPNIQKKALENFTIYITKNIEEQIKIGNYFQKLDKLIELQKKEIEKLKNIKKASLDKMFV